VQEKMSTDSLTKQTKLEIEVSIEEVQVIQKGKDVKSGLEFGKNKK
jgi:hypothetical protein